MIYLTTSNEIKSGCGLHGMIDLIVFYLLSNLVRHTLISVVWTGLPIYPGASLAQPSCLNNIFCQTNRKKSGSEIMHCTVRLYLHQSGGSGCGWGLYIGWGGGYLGGGVNIALDVLSKDLLKSWTRKMYQNAHITLKLTASAVVISVWLENCNKWDVPYNCLIIRTNLHQNHANAN